MRFYPKTDKDDSNINIIITGNRQNLACSAYVGKIPGGETEVTLNGCLTKGSVLHEILHALGKDSMKKIGLNKT